MRGRITIIALLALFLAGTGTGTGLAQSMPVKPAIGVKAGVNLSSFEVQGTSTSKRTGFVGGGYIRFPFSTHASFMVDLLYSQKGFSKNSYEDITNWEMKTDYIELPLYIRFDIPTAAVSPYIFGGFSPSVLLSAEQSSSETSGEWQDIKSQLENNNWTFIFGVGLTYKNWMLDGRFVQGLSNLATSDYPQEVEDRTISITLGYSIFK